VTEGGELTQESAAAIALETIMRHCMDTALQAKAEGNVERRMAYYDILDICKEQVEIHGYKVMDRDLAAFDPDTLLKP
jgi:hypothetical protein